MPTNINQLPFVSIILPIRNEGNAIRDTLQEVLSQNYPAELIQIIVADGLSSDNTLHIVREFQRQNSNLTLIDNPGKIVPTGLNAALRIAQGDIIIRVDGHTIISSDYVRQCVDALEASGAQNVGGRMDARGTGPFGEAVALATSTPFGVGGARFHYSDQEEWVDTVYMGAWPISTFRLIGLFDEELVRDQDDEFNYRLREHGGKILLSPKIKSVYEVRSTPKALWRQYFQYGYWKVRVLQKHPRQMRLRQFVPPTFVFSLLFLGILSFFESHARWGLGLLFSAYLLANLAATVWTAHRRGWRHMPLLPLVFAILHFSYGLGFLKGLVFFANRWHEKVGMTPVFDETPAQGVHGRT